MKTINDKEAGEWIAQMQPDELRKLVREYHALRHGLCSQTMGVPTGTSDWVDRAMAAGLRGVRAQSELRRLVSSIDSELAESRNNVMHTTCTNCAGSGAIGGDSCAVCRGTGLRHL